MMRGDNKGQMASKVILKYQNGLGEDLYKILSDNVSDISLLLTTLAIGSETYCIENGKTYRLSPARIWEEI